MLRGFTVTRASFQKDGVSLLQPTMVRYAESVFPVVCSVMDARKMMPPPVNPPKQPDWSETLVSGDILLRDQSILFIRIPVNQTLIDFQGSDPDVSGSQPNRNLKGRQEYVVDDVAVPAEVE